MSIGEFQLIERYFKRPSLRHPLGVGDDCALLKIDPGMVMAVSTDLLVEGRHFLSTVPPERLGHKALAVNLSDLAAMGAQPLAFTLSLSMPRVEERWLAEFSSGLLALAEASGCELVGGDTTAGPLTIGITVMGQLPLGQALRRDRALAGDDIWVSGTLGAARLALESWRGRWDVPADHAAAVRTAMECPQPRLALGLALRGLAHAAIDLSDGLLGDLGHVLKASGVGAVLRYADLPAAPAVAHAGPALQELALLAGGDDYELLFTAPASARPDIAGLASSLGLPLTRVGAITEAPGLTVLDDHGQARPTRLQAFDHFLEGQA